LGNAAFDSRAMYTADAINEIKNVFSFKIGTFFTIFLTGVLLGGSFVYLINMMVSNIGMYDYAFGLRDAVIYCCVSGIFSVIGASGVLVYHGETKDNPLGSGIFLLILLISCLTFAAMDFYPLSIGSILFFFMHTIDCLIVALATGGGILIVNNKWLKKLNDILPVWISNNGPLQFSRLKGINKGGIKCLLKDALKKGRFDTQDLILASNGSSVMLSSFYQGPFLIAPPTPPNIALTPQEFSNILQENQQNRAITGGSGAHNMIPSYQGTELFAFASYAHADRNRVYPIIEHLHGAGVRIWYDEGIDISKDWEEIIAVRLRKCASFVVFLSPVAATRPDVLNEIFFATTRWKNNEIQLLPVYLDEFTLPDKLFYAIGRIQGIMAASLPNIDEIATRLAGALMPAVKGAAPEGDGLARKIDELDKEFASWGAAEKKKDGKT